MSKTTYQKYKRPETPPFGPEAPEEVPEFEFDQANKPSPRESELEVRVQELENELSGKVAGYETHIAELKARLVEKDREIETLRAQTQDPDARPMRPRHRRRNEAQYPVSLPATLLLEEPGTRLMLYGRVKNIGMDGATVYFDHNVPVLDTPASMTISLPPEMPSRSKLLVEVEAAMLSTILASNGMGFRTEIFFDSFRRGSRVRLRHYLQLRKSQAQFG